MTLAARTQALLDLVERDRATQCDAIVAEARSLAEALLVRTRAESRATVHLALVEERARGRAAIAAARAELHTRQRAHRQRRTEALLAQGWQWLPEALRSRWRKAASRSQWIDRALASARSVLPRTAWLIVHGSDWNEADQRALAARLDPPPRFEIDARIDAGVRIAAGGNVVDATLAGVLADRDEIGGRLIALLESHVEPPSSLRSLPPEGALTSLGNGPTGGPE